MPGWGWDDVLPYFKKSEDYVDGPSDLHGAGGEWRVENQRLHWDILDDLARAAVQAGLAAVDDFNTGDNEGVGYFRVNQRNGWRWNTAKAFLRPAAGDASAGRDPGADRAGAVRGHAARSACGIGQNGQVQGVARARREVILCGGGDRLAADAAAVGRRAGGAVAGARDRRGAGPAADRREPAGSSATALCLQGARGGDAEHAVGQPVGQGEDRGGICAAADRADVDVAVAAGGVRANRGRDAATADLEYHVQPLSLEAFGEPTAPVRCDHRQRLQPAARKPGACADRVARSGGASRDQRRIT